MSKFSAALASYVQRNNTSQRDVALKLKMHESQLSRWVSGKRDPSIDNVKWVSKRLGIPVGDLL